MIISKIKIPFVSLILVLLLSSCLNEEFEPTKWALEPELDFSKSTVMFNSNSNNDTVAIFTNYQNIEVKSSEEWCKVSLNKENSCLNLVVSPNLDVAQRTALIEVAISRGNKYLSKNISIVQMGGLWETSGDFSLYWSYQISDSQKEIILNLLSEMIFVEGGEFIMGNTDETIVDAAKSHSVRLSPFYLGKFEITQKQWRAIMANNPSEYKTENMPVYNISWYEAIEFVTRLSELTNLNVGLPTEAQWEFAALGGNESKGFVYSGSDDLNSVAVVNQDGRNTPATVGTKIPNELGFYDMSGNVAEYCSDWFELYFVDESKIDPSGPLTGTFKCIRGGTCADIDNLYKLRVTNRFQWSDGLNNPSGLTGFRIVINP